MKTIDSLGDIAGKRVLARLDFNIPIRDGVIRDPGRIQAAIPTIERLVQAGARVILMSHLGRPKGEKNPSLSLRPVADKLGELMECPIAFVDETTGKKAHDAVASLDNGDILLLENVRFDVRETSKDDEERMSYARELADLADAYVLDGFGVAHRKQASVYDVASLLPHAGGLLLEKEIEALSKNALENPVRPYTVVIGGAKVSDKLAVIDNLMKVADRILIGGGMAYTFLKAQGKEIGTSLVQEEQIDTVLRYLQEAERNNVDIVIPVDTLVAPEFSMDSVPTVVSVDDIPDDQMGLDIGPETAKLYADLIQDSHTVVWNGPMGVFEFPSFAHGTLAVAQAMENADAYTIVGGGDSAAAVRLLGCDETKFSHISTGGGASLELLEGKTLPGLAALEG